VEDGRLIVERIPRGTPAYEAGLDAGDEIVGFADFRVRAADWDRQLANYRPGDSLPLLLARRGKLTRVTVKLGVVPVIGAWSLEAATASVHRTAWE
jgi:predicted metalloprotease with PDZ domain